MASTGNTAEMERTGRQAGHLDDVATFQAPILASLDGNPVSLIATGDVEGKSPAYLCVDQDGNSRWESVSRFKIIDPRALPLSAEAIRNLTQSRGGSGSSGSSSR